ncbi:VWA domain-containing protein [Streptomyces sp. NPDC051954]|uniref:vWA domain-containing protein n=1 Tax=unclassified Streptomyces TaxID=2593676 RepID=UPI003418795B
MTTKAILLPFYVIVDTSLSMSGEPINAANDIVPSLCDLLRENPTLRDKVRFSLIDFSSQANLRIPLSDLRNVRPPVLTADGATSYAAAFRLLGEQIAKDVDQLRADGYAYHRPAAFFITDGEPTDADDVWQRELDELSTGTNPPNIVPFGVGETNPATLTTLVRPADRFSAYRVAEGHTASEAIKDTTSILIQSVISSASGKAEQEGGEGFVLDPGYQPEAVEPVPSDITWG